MIIGQRSEISRITYSATWHYVCRSGTIPGPSAKDLRQKPGRNCRRPVKGHLHAPTLNDVLEDRLRRDSFVSTEVRRIRLLTLGVAGQHVPDGHRVTAPSMPQARPGEELHPLAAAAVPVHLALLPGRVAPASPL